MDGAETELVKQHLIAGEMIDGVRLRSLMENKDKRGSFTEFFYSSWDSGIDPAQWSVVKSRPGVLRGMHFHRRHDEFFLLIKGRCCVGLRDLRPGSPTENVSSLFELDSAQLVYVSFPIGILHGWQFFEDSIHVQSISEDYSRYHPDDNYGCHWSDPAIEIPWLEKPTLVSERAESFPSLESLLKTTCELSTGDEPWARARSQTA